MAANLALAGFLGWKWSLSPLPTCLVVQRSKYVFFLTLYDIINDIKLFWNVCIIPQPCHRHFCCWFLPIWPKLKVWAEIEFMVCADLVGGITEQICLFSDLIWYYQWYETLPKCLHYTSSMPYPILLLMAANLGLAGFFGLKMELMACADLVGGTTEQSYIFSDLIW